MASNNGLDWITIATVIATAFAGISAFLSFCAILQTNAGRAEDREAGRPYLTIGDSPGLSPIPNSTLTRIKIIVQNEGKRPAVDVACKIIFIQQDFKVDPQIPASLTFANALQSGSPTSWFYDNLTLSPKMNPQYVVVRTSYKDPLTGKDYSDSFYMQWGGVQNGKVDPNFNQVSLHQKEEIEQKLKSFAI
jgi:hypothetical protein